MKNSFFVPVILILIFLLSSCAGDVNKSGMGAASGAAGGALLGQAIGHNTEATLIGALIGTMIGYMIGNEMDKYDREQLNHVYERGVSGHSSAWRNPDTGNQYHVIPQPSYYDPRTHNPCRQAEIQSIIDGRTETIYTTACRDDYGRWQLQN